MFKKTVNYVLEGKCKDKEIYHFPKNNFIEIIGGSSIKKERIVSYQILDETNKEQYSFWKGALGAALFGDLGAAAGIERTKEYLIAIEWKDGNKSLICIDDEYYKVFVRSMF